MVRERGKEKRSERNRFCLKLSIKNILGEKQLGVYCIISKSKHLGCISVHLLSDFEVSGHTSLKLCPVRITLPMKRDLRR